MKEMPGPEHRLGYINEGEESDREKVGREMA
jgi:hypothetical protein